LVLGLGPGGDGEPHLPEDLLDLLDDAGDGVLRTAPRVARRHSGVERGWRRGGGGELGVACLDRRLERLLRAVGGGSGFAPRVRRERGQYLEQLGEPSALSAEQFHAGRVQLVERGCSG